MDDSGDDAIKEASGSLTRLQYLSWAVFALLLTIGGLLFALNDDAVAAYEKLNRLNKLLADINEYGRLITDMETSQRGFLLTADSSYLEPYRVAAPELPVLQASIESSLSDPEMSMTFGGIVAGVKAKQLELDQTLELVASNDSAAALALLNTDMGNTVMGVIRDDVVAMRADIGEHITLARAEIDQIRLTRNIYLSVLIALALLGCGATILLTRRNESLWHSTIAARARAERAKAASDEKSIFLANMSHEIRTPMNAIFGFTQLLGDLVNGERERTYVRAITQSGQVLLGLINDILDMSKIEAGKLTLIPQPVQPSELLRTCETLFARGAGEKGLALRFELADDVPASLLMDPVRVRQILINLIGNALKYTLHGQVLVRVESAPRLDDPSLVNLTMHISDTGPGIPEPEMENIFEPFTRLRPESQTVSGAGLGLSIVKRLVDMMGGTIQVQSAVSGGSTFSVTLPVVPVNTQGMGMPRESTVRLSDLPPLQILAIDDVPMNLRLLEAMFAETHHRLVTATSAEQGMRAAHKQCPDVILMDIRMPGIDGVQALELFRSQRAFEGCRIVALTASSLLGEEGRLRTLFDGYLRKPITREALAGELHRLMGQPDLFSGSTIRDADPVTAVGADWTDEELELWRYAQPGISGALELALATLSSDHVRALTEKLSVLPDSAAFAVLRQHGEAVASALTLFDVPRLESALQNLEYRVRAMESRVTAPVVKTPESAA